MTLSREQIPVRCTLMRGGTSKAVFMRMDDVPSEPAARERFLLALFGSPDRRQIDGLGGADPLTSKFAMIGPATRADADIDYTFAQIGIEEAYVSYEIVCGNISSATGVYAIEEGLVPAVEPVTTVRVHNTNTQSILIIKVPVKDGAPVVEGDFAIDGVPGTGAEVALDYSNTSGGATGRLLPTGNVRDSVHVPSLRRSIEVSIVDIGTICVYFRATDLGLTGSELPGEITAPKYLAAEEIRQAAAALCQMPQSGSKNITPFQIMIAPPRDYTSLPGEAVRAADVDFVARQINVDGWMHKAFAGGASTCTAVAAQIVGTIVHECSSVDTSPRRVRIGHPSGVLPIYAQVEQGGADGPGWVVREVHFSRTVRRLMDGTAYIRRSLAVAKSVEMMRMTDDESVEMTPAHREGTRYRFSGHERILHRTPADKGLPELMDWFGYRRAYVVCSRTLNTRTDVIRRLETALGERCVGVTDAVGEHSPLSNVLAAAREANALDADVIVSVGGGSVMDMCKTMQLCITEQVFDRSSLLQLQMKLSADGTEVIAATRTSPRVRQIAIPTTLATSEWTPVSTPIDEQTHLKARFLTTDGSPRGIVYDPELLARTPLSLLFATGIRGLDHAINTACSTQPHPFASLMAEKAIQLYVENLPRLRDSTDVEAFSNCQLATWYTGMGQLSVPHGFSHWMVHIVGPLANIPHSEAACVLMLAQARWSERHASAQHGNVLRLLGRSGSFANVLDGLLAEMGLPRSLQDLGLSPEQVESFIQPALDHPQVTRNNLRPITTAEDLRAVLHLADRTYRPA